MSTETCRSKGSTNDPIELGRYGAGRGPTVAAEDGVCQPVALQDPLYVLKPARVASEHRVDSAVGRLGDQHAQALRIRWTLGSHAEVVQFASLDYVVRLPSRATAMTPVVAGGRPNSAAAQRRYAALCNSNS